MSPPAPAQSFNRNFGMHTSNRNHFSIPAPHMWVPAPIPYFAAYPGMPCPYSGTPPLPPHPPYWFAPPPAVVPCHPCMMHPSYACTLPVRSQQHALHNGSPAPQVPSSQLPQTHTFTPYLDGPVRNSGQRRNSDASLQTTDPSRAQTSKKCRQPEWRKLHTKRESEVATQSSQQADHDDSSQKSSSRHSDSSPSLQARDPLEVQTPTEVAATSELQAEDDNSLQNHSLLLSKATSISGVCSQNEKAPNEEARLQTPVESENAYQISTECTGGKKSEDFEYLPSDESVFYEWWEFTPTPSPEQLALAWLELGRDNEEVASSQVLSKSSDDTPSSPQSVLETIHPLLEWFEMLHKNFDCRNRTRFSLKVGTDYDAESQHNACLEELNELTKELAKNKDSMNCMLTVAGRCPEALQGTNFSDLTREFVHS